MEKSDQERWGKRGSKQSIQKPVKDKSGARFKCSDASEQSTFSPGYQWLLSCITVFNEKKARGFGFLFWAGGEERLKK